MRWRMTNIEYDQFGALVVVDVQCGFEAASKVIDACRKLIIEKVNLHEPIFIVEYLGFGETYGELTRPLMKYPQAYFLRKNDMDGSLEVYNACSRANLPQHISHFDVCGVYKNDCVLATVLGMLGRFSDKTKFIAHIDAMNSCQPTSPMWDRLEPQVRLSGV